MENNIKCDFCHEEPAMVDGLTKYGVWAFMCKECFKEHGVGEKGTYTTLVNIGKEGRVPYED